MNSKSLLGLLVSLGLLSLSVCAAEISAEGVLEVSVSSGTQDGFTADQLAALRDPACVELRKTGVGKLQLTSNATIKDFAGKITIAAGIYSVKNGSGVEGFLGTGDGATVVESGATIEFYAYLKSGSYKDEEITLSGDGCDGRGALSHPDTNEGQITLSFKKMTLAGNTLIRSYNSARGFTLVPKVLDMGGYEMKLMSGTGVMSVDPKEIVNDGHLYYKTDAWGLPSVARMEGGPEHVLTIDATRLLSYGSPHTNFCNWTLRIANAAGGIRAYAPPFIWDGPLVLPDSGTVSLYANKNDAQPDGDLCFMRFNGPVYGTANTIISNGGDNQTSLIFASAQNAETFKGKMMWANANRRTAIVSMVPGAVPNALKPNSCLVKNSNGYQNSIAIGLRSGSNPNGYTTEQVFEALEDAFVRNSENLQMYVEKGQTVVMEMDWGADFNYYWRNSTCLRAGAIGGGEMIVSGKYDLCSPFRNFVGESLILTTRPRTEGINQFSSFNIDGGLLRMRDMGYFEILGLTCGSLGSVERAELRLEAGCVMGRSSNGISIGSRNTGAGGRLWLCAGSTITNHMRVASMSSYANCTGLFVLDGGLFCGSNEITLGGATNSTGSIEIRSGDFIESHNMFLARYAQSSSGEFVQQGGTIRLGQDDSEIKYVACGPGTSSVHVASGTFNLNGSFYLPKTIAETTGTALGHAELTVDGGHVRVSGRVVLCDRSDSVGQVTVSGEGVLETGTILKQTVSSIGEDELSGGYAAVSFDGGTLKAARAGELIAAGEQAPDAVTVGPHGLTVDTAGFDAAIPVPLASVPTAGGIVALTLPDGKPLTSYHTRPRVLIFGDGHGAVAEADYDPEAFTVSAIRVLNPGWGYTAGKTTALVFQYALRTPVVLTVEIGANAASGGLVKKGAGVLTLSAANTYQGATVVEEGGLRVAGDAAVPADLTLAGGWLETADAAAFPSTLKVSLGTLDRSKRRYELARFPNGKPETIPTVTGDYIVPPGETWKVCYRDDSLVLAYFQGLTLLLR